MDQIFDQKWQFRFAYRDIKSDIDTIDRQETLFAYLIIQAERYLWISGNWQTFRATNPGKLQRNRSDEYAVILHCGEEYRDIVSASRSIVHTWPVHLFPLLATHLRVIRRAAAYLQIESEWITRFEALEKHFLAKMTLRLDAGEILAVCATIESIGDQIEYLVGERQYIADLMTTGEFILVDPETNNEIEPEAEDYIPVIKRFLRERLDPEIQSRGRALRKKKIVDPKKIQWELSIEALVRFIEIGHDRQWIEVARLAIPDLISKHFLDETETNISVEDAKKYLSIKKNINLEYEQDHIRWIGNIGLLPVIIRRFRKDRIIHYLNKPTYRHNSESPDAPTEKDTGYTPLILRHFTKTPDGKSKDGKFTSNSIQQAFTRGRYSQSYEAIVDALCRDLFKIG
ncbi:MAG: hypothetical protein HN337_07315 [Deltaproteobacteria bacterium]|jgi:hypothetical protein|nr:hypothetical protein [Deltaproteobacteria bacterium]